jgi:uncharacterized integral membrane protein
MLKQFRKRVRWAIIGIIVLLVAIVAFQNREYTETHILMMHISMPRAVLIVVTGGIGFVAGWLTGRWR